MIQRLFTLVITAAHASAALTTDSVDLVDEDDARRGFLCLLEHVAHTRRTDTDEHFHKVGTGDGEERYFSFARDGSRQQGFAGTGAAHQQNAARDTTAKLLKLTGVAQKFNQLGNFFFCFIATGHIGKGRDVGGFVQHTCPAFAKGKSATAPAALHLPHEKYPDANQQQHREPGNKYAGPEGLFFGWFGFDFDAVLQQIVDQPNIARRIGHETRAILALAAHGVALDLHFGNLFAFHFLHEGGKVHGRGSGAFGCEL